MVLENFNLAVYGSQIIYWVGITIVFLFTGLVLYGIYYLTNYPIKMTYFILTGSGEKGRLSIDRAKTTRWRKVQDGNAWKQIFKNKEIKPFDPNHIYGGQQVYAFKYGDEYVPAEITFNMDGGEILPVPYEVKNWVVMRLKQNEAEFKHKDFWDENKHLITLVVVTGCMCLMVILVIYYTYKYAGGGRIDAMALTDFKNYIGSLGKVGVPR